MLRKVLLILPLFGVLLVGCGKDQVTLNQSAPKSTSSAPWKAPTDKPAKADAC